MPGAPSPASTGHPVRRGGRLLSALLASTLWFAPPGGLAATEHAPGLTQLPLPLPASFASPALTATPRSPILSWLEGTRPGGLAMRYATLGETGWSEPGTVVRDAPFWLSWADTPWLTELDDGTQLAHWPERAGNDRYDYVTRMALKRPGETWGEAFLLHDDASPVQHGLPSVVRHQDGERHYLWLDARDGATALYTRTLDGRGHLGPERRIDTMTCSCCRIALVALMNGDLLAAYRDQTPEEVRDIRIQRHTASDGWRETGWQSGDGWVIAGCPVNGPALATHGERVAVAWFTAAQDRNRVLLAVSDDGGQRFAAPLRIDAGDPIGRPSLLFDTSGRLLVAWMEWTAEGTRIFMTANPGTPGAIKHDLTAASGRFSGSPQLLTHGEETLLFLAAESTARLYRVALPR